MAELMTRLAELVVEINRIDPDNDDPMRHAKRHCRRMAQATLDNAVEQAWIALHAVQAMEDAVGDKAIRQDRLKDK